MSLDSDLTKSGKPRQRKPGGGAKRQFEEALTENIPWRLSVKTFEYADTHGQGAYIEQLIRDAMERPA